MLCRPVTTAFFAGVDADVTLDLQVNTQRSSNKLQSHLMFVHLPCKYQFYVIQRKHSK